MKKLQISSFILHINAYFDFFVIRAYFFHFILLETYLDNRIKNVINIFSIHIFIYLIIRPKLFNFILNVHYYIIMFVDSRTPHTFSLEALENRLINLWLINIIYRWIIIVGCFDVSWYSQLFAHGGILLMKIKIQQKAVYDFCFVHCAVCGVNTKYFHLVCTNSE